MWSFGLPGTKPLEEDETFRTVFLAGANSDVTSGNAEGLTATFDQGIVNTYFSYGYTEGLYRSAQFNVIRNGQVLTMEAGDMPRAGDVLDFQGVPLKPEDQKVLRLQTFGGVRNYWNVGRGMTLPVSNDVPAVEFRVLRVIGAEPELVEIGETVISQQQGPVEDDDWRVYENMLPKQSTFGALTTAGRNMLGKFATSIGNRFTGGKAAAPTQEEQKEDDYVEQIRPGPNRFQSFEMDVSEKTRKNTRNGQ